MHSVSLYCDVKNWVHFTVSWFIGQVMYQDNDGQGLVWTRRTDYLI